MPMHSFHACSVKPVREAFIEIKRNQPDRWRLVDRLLRQSLVTDETREALAAFQEGPDALWTWVRENSGDCPDHEVLWRRDRGGRRLIHLVASSLQEMGPSKDILRYLLRSEHAEIFEDRDLMGFSVLDHVTLSLERRESIPLVCKRDFSMPIGGPDDKIWWDKAVRVFQAGETPVMESFQPPENKVFVFFTCAPETVMSEEARDEIRQSFPTLPHELIRTDAIMEFRAVYSKWNHEAAREKSESPICRIAVITVPLSPKITRNKRKSGGNKKKVFMRNVDWKLSRSAFEVLSQYVRHQEPGHFYVAKFYPITHTADNANLHKEMDKIFDSPGLEWSTEFPLKGGDAVARRRAACYELNMQQPVRNQGKTRVDKIGYDKKVLFTFANALMFGNDDKAIASGGEDTVVEDIGGKLLSFPRSIKTIINDSMFFSHWTPGTIISYPDNLIHSIKWPRLVKRNHEPILIRETDEDETHDDDEAKDGRKSPDLRISITNRETGERFPLGEGRIVPKATKH
jgi:hypothetical protein